MRKSKKEFISKGCNNLYFNNDPRSQQKRIYLKRNYPSIALSLYHNKFGKIGINFKILMDKLGVGFRDTLKFSWPVLQNYIDLCLDQKIRRTKKEKKR